MSKKKIIRWSIFVIAILIVLIIVLVSLGNIEQVLDVFKNHFNPLMFFLCLGMILLYAFTYKLSLIILVRRKYKNIPLWRLYFISGSEFFFNAITPFSTGGQPFQAYALKRCKVSLSDSTSQLLLNFVAYQIALNLVSVVCVIMYFDRLFKSIDNFIIFLVVGFSINILIMILLVLIGTSKLFGKALIKMINGICKIKFINKLVGDKTEDVTKYVNEMQEAFKEMGQNISIWIICLITKVLANVIYYMIPFVGFRVFGVEISMENFLYCFALTSFCLTTTIWVPLPGASGRAELVLLILFKLLVPNVDGINLETGMNIDTIATAGMLVWRFFTYYFMICYGLFDYLMFEAFSPEKFSKNEDNVIDLNDNLKTNDTEQNNSLEIEKNDIILNE